MTKFVPIIINIDGKKIGSNNATYFVAEGGLNHNGDIKIAKRLIDEAYKSKADAIKFQTYRTEEFLSSSSEYFKFFKKVELKLEDFGELKDHAKGVGITFFSAPFDMNSADYLKKIGVPCFKIASSDLTNIPLIQHIAKMNIPVIISTGLATISEVEDAVNVCLHESNNKIILLHSVANYPTRPEEANLSAIDTIKKKFNFPVGYSDNGEPALVAIVAVSIGANLIEKHFTLDKKMEGPDHSFSIEPLTLKNLIQQVREVEVIKGMGTKNPQPSELSNITKIRKSLTAATNIHKGEYFSKENLAIKRPAEGIAPKYWNQLLGRKAKKDIKNDTMIHWQDVE